jgi:hypothetical protein
MCRKPSAVRGPQLAPFYKACLSTPANVIIAPLQEFPTDNARRLSRPTRKLPLSRAALLLILLFLHPTAGPTTTVRSAGSRCGGSIWGIVVLLTSPGNPARRKIHRFRRATSLYSHDQISLRSRRLHSPNRSYK